MAHIARVKFRMDTALLMLRFSGAIGDYMESTEGKTWNDILGLFRNVDDDDLADLHEQYGIIFFDNSVSTRTMKIDTDSSGWYSVWDERGFYAISTGSQSSLVDSLRE